MKELTTGSTFAGRYQVIEELGKGGMGKVYKVFDTRVKEKIALKLIRPEIALDRETIERFSNELRSARKIRHKNVCQMFDLGEAEGAHFITMEYVPGEDLKNMIRMSKSMSVGAAINIASQICEGLAEAHRLGVIHRDLKPGNIMIDREGDVRIMDFGVARTLKEKGVTGAGMVVGTPEYMSPEQVEGQEVGQQSDLYSLGVILYEMVTGRRPFEGQTALSIALKQKTEMPRNPRELNAQVPEALSRLILKCLEKDKRNRYQAAGEILAELGQVEAGIPTPEKEIPQGKALTSREITVKLNLRKVLLPTILVIAAVAAVIFFFLNRKPGSALNPKLALVSVFLNRTGDATLDAIGQYAADVISRGLSQMGIVEVVPTVSILDASRVINARPERTKGQADLTALAKSTGAGTIVSGAYYLIDNKLQFDAKITDIVHRKEIPPLEPLKGSPDDKMRLITELRQRVMGAMAMHFTGVLSREYAQAIRQPPVYEAYQEFLQGLEDWGVDYEQSARHFTQAIELDPTFALPKLWLAVSFGDRNRYEEAAACLRSIFAYRDELSPVDNRILEWYDAKLKGQYEKALQSVREAEKLAPNQYTIKYLVGLYAKRLDRPRETVEVYAWMYFQDPKRLFTRASNAWMIQELAEAHHMLGEYKKELKAAGLGKKYFPRDLDFLAIEARALAALGKLSEVRAVVERSQNLDAASGTPGGVMMEAARELYAHENKDASRAMVAAAIEWAESRPQAERNTEERQRFYANALYFAGRFEEAGRIYGSLAAGHPGDIDYQGISGVLAARRGDREVTLRVSGELAKLERPFLFGGHLYWQACIAALLGEQDRAVALLKEAFSQGRGYDVYLHSDVNLESLWDYPLFKELLRPKG